MRRREPGERRQEKRKKWDAEGETGKLKNEGKGRLEKREGGFRMGREEGGRGRKEGEGRKRKENGDADWKSREKGKIDREGG